MVGKRLRWVVVAWVLFLAGILLTGCSRGPVYTTVAGMVVDSTGVPMANAAIFIGDVAGTSNSSGRFSLTQVRSDATEAIVIQPGRQPEIIPVALAPDPQQITLTVSGQPRRARSGAMVDFIVLLPSLWDTDLDHPWNFTYLSQAEVAREAKALLGIQDLRTVVDYLTLQELGLVCDALKTKNLVWISDELKHRVQVYNRDREEVQDIPFTQISSTGRDGRRSVRAIGETLAAWLGEGPQPQQKPSPAERDEATLAKGAREYIENRYKVTYHGPEVERIKGVAAPIFANSERPTLSFTLGILETKEYNALALPGGYIYITRPLLNLMETESELAAVIAHETAHITHMHAVDNYRRQLVTVLATVFLTVATGDAQGSVDLVNFFEQFIAEGYSKSQEYDADATGFRYLIKAGYDPDAMASMLEKLLALELKFNGREVYSRTHPATSDRIRAINNHRERMGYYRLLGQYL